MHANKHRPKANRTRGDPVTEETGSSALGCEDNKWSLRGGGAARYQLAGVLCAAVRALFVQWGHRLHQSHQSCYCLTAGMFPPWLPFMCPVEGRYWSLWTKYRKSSSMLSDRQWEELNVFFYDGWWMMDDEWWMYTHARTHACSS